MTFPLKAKHRKAAYYYLYVEHLNSGVWVNAIHFLRFGSSEFSYFAMRLMYPELDCLYDPNLNMDFQERLIAISLMIAIVELEIKESVK